MTKSRLLVLWALGGLVLCLPLAASIFVIQVFREPQSEAEITIANASSESIASGEVEAQGHIYPFQSIAIGQRATVSFPIAGDGGYRIRAQLESGRRLDSGAERYLVPGFGVDDQADVTNDGINIRAIMPFRVKLIRKDGSETLTPEITNEPLPNRLEAIDVEIGGQTIKAVAHLLTWVDPAPQQSGLPTPVVVAVETE